MTPAPEPPAIHSTAPPLPAIRAYGGASGAVSVYVTWPGRVLCVFGMPAAPGWVEAPHLHATLVFTDNPRLVWPAGAVDPASNALRREPLRSGRCWLVRESATRVRFASRGLGVAGAPLPDVAPCSVSLGVTPP